MAHDPFHPGAVEEPGRTALQWVRTVLAFLLGLTAVLALTGTLVLGLTAAVTLSDDDPGAPVRVTMAVQEARQMLAESVVESWEEEHGLDPGLREPLVRELTAALAADEVRTALATAVVTEDQADLEAFAGALANAVEERADGAAGPLPDTLSEMAASLRSDWARPGEGEQDGLGDEVEGFGSAEDREAMRRFVYVASGVIAVGALVPYVAAVGVANRRGLTAALVPSLALAGAGLLLALTSAADPAASVPAVLGAIGDLAGPTTVWTLFLLGLLPLAVWGAARAMRSDVTATGA